MKSLFPIFLILVYSFQVDAQVNMDRICTMIKDINVGEGGSEPKNIASCNDIMFFAANDAIHGEELWISDGTQAGTKMVADLAPGTTNSAPSKFTYIDNGKVVFLANDNIHGLEPWVTDGTELGTKMLADIMPGIKGSGSDFFIRINGKVVFLANDNIHGLEPWVTDGTVGGTHILMNVNPIGSNIPSNWSVYNGLLYFSGRDGSDEELWVTDGTSAGTHLFADLNAVPHVWTAPSDFVAYMGKLFFVGYKLIPPNITKREIYVTDGTVQGTHVVTDNSLLRFPAPRGLTGSNGLIYYANSDSIYQSIWVTDGTINGTTKLVNIPATIYNWEPTITDNDGIAYFRGPRYAYGPYFLWRSDGTVAGTQIVDTNFSDIGEMISVKGNLFFECKGSLYYVSNGSNIKKAIGKNGQDGWVAPHKAMAKSGGTLYLSGSFTSSSSPSNLGYELWRIDQEPTSTKKIYNKQIQSIFPNPATNTFSVKNSGATVKVYSLTGQLMLETHETQNINIQQLSPGIYQVQIITNGQTHTEKLIKE